MKYLIISLLFAAVAIGAASSEAQTEPTAAPPEVQASDAPVIDMRRHCRRRSVRRNDGPYYPAEAMRQNVEGRAVLDCSLTSEGALHECQVVEETPAGMQFGDASLRLACDPRFIAAPQSGASTTVYERDGVRRFRRAVNWRLG